MHLVIWTFAVLVSAACARANDHTCKTNDHKCETDDDCKTPQREEGKCNTEQNLCCMFGDAPPTQCFPSDCTNNDGCRQHGMQFLCNTDNGQCCGNVMTDHTCKTNDHKCETDDDCKTPQREEGKCNTEQNLCCMIGENMVLSNPCPGESYTWMGECPYMCTATTDCSTSEACCAVGSTCNRACLPDLRPCANVTQILLAAITDQACLPKVLEITNQENSFEQYCGALFEGLECIADSLVGPLLGDVCFGRMMQFIESQPTVLYDQIKVMLTEMGMQIELNDKFANQSGSCKGIVDGTGMDDMDWNTVCPKIEEDKYDDGCTTDCSIATDCTMPEYPVCCSVGMGQCHTCMPDFRQCGNVTMMLNSSKLLACLSTLTPLVAATNTVDYCSAVWATLDCLAEQLATAEYKTQCLLRMAIYVREAPDEIIDTVSDMVSALGIDMTTLQKYSRSTGKCRESPLHKAPSRPVSDDVDQCANASIVLHHVTECVSASEPAMDDVCSVFKAMVDCVTESIFADEEPYVKRKCAEEIYELINLHRDKIPGLNQLDSRTCRDTASVCGGDIRPLEDHNCTLQECPYKFECKRGYCCPSEATMMSKCESEFEHGKKELERLGTCGDGRSIINLPSCQNTRCHPIQVDIHSGRMYCATEDCDKIPGSDFTGNRDCTKVRAGKCPSLPAECSETGSARNDCENDNNCMEGQRCCLATDSGLCIQKCVAADTAPDSVVDDCQDRKCCPVSLCQHKICLKDKTAVCRINSCSGCTTDFYNVDGEKVNCDEGVSVCEKQRAKAILENAKKRESGADRVFSFVSTRNMREREDKAGGGDNMGRNMDAEDDESDERKDEYGESRREKNGLMEDSVRGNGEDQEGGKDTEAMSLRFCAFFQQYDVCKNGGECIIGAGESFLEICKCPSGYYGLFCEKNGSVEPLDTQCHRDVERSTTLLTLFNEQKQLKEQMVLHGFFNTFMLSHGFMVHYSCSASGAYNETQIGTILPQTPDMMAFYFCANTLTGKRILGTPVTLSVLGQLPNCDVTNAYPDAMRIPHRCLAPYMESCTGTSDSCQYFWNQETGGCMKGKAGYGFSTLTKCYDQCAMHRGCINHSDGSDPDDDFECDMGLISGPKPCRATKDNVEVDICDYKSEFCEVVENLDGTQTGTCTAFPAHCLESPNEGVGDKAIGGYYFKAEYRRCEKFDYKGDGGNKNRFYNLHQCHAECSAQPYRFTDSVCPIPRALNLPGMPVESLDMCDTDYNCIEGEVCCSNGKAKVCAHPVKTCYTGERCSQDGVCDAGACVCDDCINAVTSPVCGSDGTTYTSVCHVKREACKTMHNIHVASNGSCTTECGSNVCESYEVCDNNMCTCGSVCITVYSPICAFSRKSGVYRTFGNTCEMNSFSCNQKERFVKVMDGECDQGACVIPCTKEYLPFCVNDITESTPKLETYSNFCAIKAARICDNKTLEVLYQGKCHKQCGVNECAIYEDCEGDTCNCAQICQLQYKPICAYPQGNNATLTTFSNECMLRQHACTTNTIYVISSHGNCKDPEPVYSCPANKPDVQYSADIACNIDTHAYCDHKKGDMCCPHGAGRKCVKKMDLVRHKEMKGGVCPQFSYMNYEEAYCVDDIRCMDDSDCVSDALCCQNQVCGYSTCSEPLVRANGCGAGKKMVPSMTCTLDMASTGCPTGSTCTSATNTPEEVGICCVADTQPDVNVEDIVSSKLCQLLELLGITCENGGNCVGNFRTGPICDCTAGYVGTFCESTDAPSATPCLEQQAVLRQFYEKMVKPWIQAAGDEPVGWDVDVFQEKFLVLLEHLRLRGLPVDGELKCADNGSFKPEQCITDMKSHADVCHCVNTHTGVPVKNGPSQSTTDTLNCDIFNENNVARQEFCITEKPNMDGLCSGDSLADRYFYDAATADCEQFTDAGCNTDISNNFDSYESCTSACGVDNTRLSLCASVRCGNGQHCRVKDGAAICIDPEDGGGMFEPTCDSEGKFHPKQCQGTVCQCVNPDTGEEIADSVADGKNLECKKEGNSVQPIKKEEKECDNNRVARFCKGGGDSCKDCVRKDVPNNAEHDESVDDNGVCLSCETCPAGQRDKVCNMDKLCKNTCKQFADATCHVNKCTCKEEYIGAGTAVNCNAAQSKCLKEKHHVEAEQRSLKSTSRNQQDTVKIKCSTTGGYYAKCKGNDCFCLNAATGATAGNAQHDVNVETITCESTQRKTKAEILDVEFKISNKPLSELSQPKQDKMKRTLKSKIEVTTAVSVVGEIKLKSGSVIGQAEITTCEGECVPTDTSDLVSLGEVVIAEMTDWEFEVDGEQFKLSEFEVVNVTTTEMLYGPVTTALPLPHDTEEETTIIIVVVIVVAIVILLAIGLACYCYSKANKSKAMDMPFTDVQARTNAAYGKAY